MGHRCIIAIDPGKRTGWAVFWEAELWSAGYTDNKELPEIPLLPAIVVIEVPRIYPFGGKGDANDLVDLAFLAGDYAGEMRVKYPGVDVEQVYPRTWKGTVPKHIHNRRVLASLTSKELPKIQGCDHNMVDAIGIGLWQLGKEGQR